MTVKRLRELLAGFEDEVLVMLKVDDGTGCDVEGTLETLGFHNGKAILYLSDCDYSR